MPRYRVSQQRWVNETVTLELSVEDEQAARDKLEGFIRLGVGPDLAPLKWEPGFEIRDEEYEVTKIG